MTLYKITLGFLVVEATKPYPNSKLAKSRKVTLPLSLATFTSHFLH